jgi:hypothetical protein
MGGGLLMSPVPLEIIIQLVIAAFSATVSSIAAYLLYKLQAREHKRERESEERKKREEHEAEVRQREYAAIKSGLTAMLRDRLIQSGELYERKGWIPFHSFENVSLLYAAYHEMGGNGIVTQLYNGMKELPHHAPTEGDAG